MKTAIKIENLSKTYVINKQKQKVLDNVNLEILPGEFVLLRGDNGSGKTTLVNLICGLQAPDEGSIEIFGKSPKDPQAHLKLGTMLQRAKPVEGLTVKETIRLFQSYYPKPFEVNETIERSRLTGKQNDYATSLAGGQAQSLYFALAIVGNPDILILDEPTNNLSVEARANFWKQVREFDRQGKTILAISHSEQDCDEIADLVTRELRLSNETGDIEIQEFPRYQALLNYCTELEAAANVKSESSSQRNTSSTAQSAPRSFSFKAFWGQLYVELLQSFRKVDTIIISLGLAMVAGVSIEQNTPEQFQSLLAASLAALVIFVCVSQFGVKIASERDRGWLKLLRITPLSFTTYVAAKVGNFLVLASLMTGLAFLSGWGASQFSESGSFIWEPWMFYLSFILVLGVVPFAIFSFSLGYLFKTESLQWAILAFLAIMAIGLGFNISPLLPQPWIADVVLFLPTYHYGQLVAWMGEIELEQIFRFDGYHWIHILWLLWWTVVAGMFARWVYRREQLSG
ncbi:ABC transporter ATP-binding protein/permease [Geitlerinema sp. P-1104]|uniref:ABC transporter ATP-binding protein/permease n=1 Tax=Geitlerinema sp. P-1104 TaxID=2546230 RepID=UPI001476AF69|nr:ABC transporter ATP-binding protein/permease [Geitlerinema sp. P-1104]NMG60756.1 ABC transporter ATP-binding protein/permease [Geitlerinema sp. P-1104]